MNWLSKRFTFVMIPDANQSVRQYRVSGLVLVLIPAIVVLLAVSTIIFWALFARHASITGDLQAQLSASESQFEQQLSLKEADMDSLQSNLVALSEQAKTMESKMAEINELEAQLKQLVGIEPSKSLLESKFVEEEGGQGGEELPLPADASGQLVSETRQSYEELDQQLEELKPHLEQTREAVLQYQEILQITPTIWPTDSRKVTSLFGTREDPFTGRATYHSGLDIGGSTGDPVYAAADGVVVLAESDRVHGINVQIDHGRGIKTRYLHLHDHNVEAGERVVKGQVIGELGNTGRSTGPHLHYEVSVGGVDVDPEPYIKADRKEP